MDRTEGTCPACGAPEGDGARCPSCGLPRPAPGHRVRFRRVLVADDSPFYLEGVAGFLRGRGLTGDVLTAVDGAGVVEAVAGALVARRPVSLAVLDVMMPRLNGIQVATALRAVERGFGARPAVVLFLSSRPLGSSLESVLGDLSPAYYLNKGADRPDVLEGRLLGVLEAIAAPGIRPD